MYFYILAKFKIRNIIIPLSTHKTNRDLIFFLISAYKLNGDFAIDIFNN